MKKNSLCVCVCVRPFASESKKHFFRKTDFLAPDGRKRVCRVKKRFSKKIRLLRNPPEGGAWSGSKKHFFQTTDFPSPDAKKSVFRVNKRFSIKFDQRESCTKNLNLLQIER